MIKHFMREFEDISYYKGLHAAKQQAASSLSQRLARKPLLGCQKQHEESFLECLQAEIGAPIAREHKTY